MSAALEGTQRALRDAHAAPPVELKRIYKKYQLARGSRLEHAEQIVDFERGLTDCQHQEWHECVRLSADQVKVSCAALEGEGDTVRLDLTSGEDQSAGSPGYESNSLPGEDYYFSIPL